MKTIFDKVDPKYLEHTASGVECMTGACSHSTHTYNAIMILSVIGVAAAMYVYRIYSTD